MCGGKFHIDGNVVIGSERATNDNWTYGVQFDSKWSHISDAERQSLRLENPLGTGVVTTHAAEEAYQKVLRLAGASLKRDSVDQRIIHDVSTGTATCMDGGNGSTHGFIDTQDAVGVWPELKSLPAPTDTDGDGMPDAWEVAKGLAPNDPSDGNAGANHDGYTHLEDYLNSLALRYYDAKPIISTISPKVNEIFIAPSAVTIDVDAYANDYNGGSIARMELYVDEQLVKAEDEASRIAATLDSLSHGMHRMVVKATDDTGNVSTETTTVYVGTQRVRVAIKEDARNGRVTMRPEGGLYTEGVDVRVEAVPDEGYRFHSWIEDIESDQKLLTIKTANDITLKPVFVPTEDPLDKYRKPIRITFGPLEGFYAAPGYIVDGGSQYSEKLNGYTYGWLEGYHLGGEMDPSESNIVRSTHNVFESEASNHSWGMALPKGSYKVTLGLGAKQSQQAIKVNLGQLAADRTPILINEPIVKDTYKEYVIEEFEVKDGGSGLANARLTLSSANQTKIYFMAIELVRMGGNRKLRVTNGSGSGAYNDMGGPILITATPPAEGMVFDKWIGNAEPQYFEKIDQWKRSREYIEDIYSSTTFVTDLDYVTSVSATYRKK